MSYQNHFIENQQKKYSAKSYFSRYIIFYWVFKGLIAIALTYSAFASYNFYVTTFASLPYPEAIALFVTAIVSFLIYLFTMHSTELWHYEYKIDFIAPILALLIAWNAYTDWVGVQDTVYNVIERPVDKETARLDGLYSNTIAGFDKAIAKENKAIEANMHWSDKGKAKWGMYNRWKQATENYTRIQREKEVFISQYTKQREQSLSSHQSNIDRYQSNVDRLSGSLKGAVAVCLAIVLCLGFWCAKFEKKCVTSCLTGRTREQTSPNTFVVSKKNYPETSRLIAEGYSLRKAIKQAGEGCKLHVAHEISKKLRQKQA